MAVGTVRITVGELDAYIRSPFAARDVIRDMPDRQWNPAAKHWVIPAPDVPLLVRALEAAGFRVLVANVPKSEPNEEGANPWARRGGGTSWADQMFTALGPDLAERAYKALSRICHPDVGGSTEIMQLLNVARDKIRQAA